MASQFRSGCGERWSSDSEISATLGATAFAGGLGGSRDGGPDVFGSSYDFGVGISWRIGPGGLFDSGRKGAAKARLNESLLADQKRHDQVLGEVVASQVRCQSLATQIEIARRNIATATQAEQVAEQRKQFGVGQVLEDIDTQQELTRARSEYANLVAEYDKAQYALRRAVGQHLSAAR